MAWAAELTRLHGASIASDILDEHEKSGRHQAGWAQDAENMDRHNNTVGMRIGKTAKDYSDVLPQGPSVSSRGPGVQVDPHAAHR